MMNELLLLYGLLIYTVSDILWTKAVKRKFKKIEQEIEIININMKR